MSETTATVHESYAFACMRCGHGWEQSYDIAHHFDGDGREFVVYTVDGARVPSPLTHPTCLNCDGHLVRIMGAGQVSSANDQLHPDPDPEPKPDRHHWHLTDLFHRAWPVSCTAYEPASATGHDRGRGARPS